MKIIKCIVAAFNSNGEPDLFCVSVQGTEEQFNDGLHYDAAKDAATDNGYEPYLAFAEDDMAWQGFAQDIIDWATVETVSIAV